MMNHIFSVLLFSACLIVGLNGAYVRNSRKSCAQVTTKPDFDATQYVGVWYDITKLPFIGDLSCVRAVYSPRSSNSINVYNEGMYANGEYSIINGTATQKDPSQPGNLTVKLGGNPEASYLVLETDYYHVSTVYSCRKVGSYTLEFAWVLARDNSISDEILNKAMAVFSQYGINTDDFVMTSHENCKYIEL